MTALRNGDFVLIRGTQLKPGDARFVAYAHTTNHAWILARYLYLIPLYLIVLDRPGDRGRKLPDWARPGYKSAGVFRFYQEQS